MQHLVEVSAGQYRLKIHKGDTAWDDPIAPEVTSDVLGARTATVISRTSLLAWSLMNLPCVEIAHVVGAGRIDLTVKKDAEFDRLEFTFQVAELVFETRELHAHRLKPAGEFRSGLRNISRALVRHLRVAPETRRGPSPRGELRNLRVVLGSGQIPAHSKPNGTQGLYANAVAGTLGLD